jgi:hypothetical protein
MYIVDIFEVFINRVVLDTLMGGISLPMSDGIL